MNDNVIPEGPHHAYCLGLINDLHDLFAWAEKMGLKINCDDEDITNAMDFAFWREHCGIALGVSAVRQVG